MLQSKCLVRIKELSKAGCLEKTGLRLKREKQSGLNCEPSYLALGPHL